MLHCFIVEINALTRNKLLIDMIDAQTILYSFLFVLVTQEFVEVILLRLNLRHAGTLHNELNVLLQPLYEKREKSLQYTRSKTNFSIVTGIYDLFLLLVVLYFSLLPKFDSWLRNFHLGDVVHGTVYIVVLMLVASIVSLPFSWYSNFVIEERFGFNKLTIRLWIRDVLLGLVINLVLMFPLIFTLLWFMQFAGPFWWLYAGTFLIAMQLILTFVYPLWIAPLFNKFTELENGELKSEIVALVDRIGYRTTGVFKIDGSKRSKHANAYFTGIGKSKRIVLYDTLIELLSKDQILAVLAHEIGHEKLGHIKKSLVLSAFLTIFGLLIVGMLIEYMPIYQAFGFGGRENHIALLIFSLLGGPFMFFISPLFNVVSRRFEYQADYFALKATAGSSLATALVTLTEKSLSNITPHPFYSFMHYSHPTINERLNAMQRSPLYL